MKRSELHIKESDMVKKGASDQVIEFIQKKISSGEWTQGMKIATEEKLKEQTGVSKASVREAVEKLVAMDILTKRQGDGTYVNQLSSGTMFQQLMPGFFANIYDPITILEFREVIEPACARMFIEHYDEERFHRLEEYLQCMKDAQKEDREAFYQADRNFHLTLAIGAGNAILVKIMEILNDAITNYHYIASKTIGAKSGVKEHEGILEAIRLRDKELAELLMKRHIQRSRRDIEAYQAVCDNKE